jgi:tryptophan synthase alpha chain
MSSRITKTFSDNKKKLVTFITGGDPNFETSKKIIKTIAENGEDIIEIGMPFSDPLADGPAIELSSSRAIKQGINLDYIFSICKDLRNTNSTIPVILMGYYNVVFHKRKKKFVSECQQNGVDGLIIVDLQPEEDSELLSAIKSTDLDLIRLITPTTNTERLEKILKHSSGFLYYVTITGITGQNSANLKELKQSIINIKNKTKLPVVSGFGIKNREQVKKVCEISDGAVVGSSIVEIIKNNINNEDKMITLVANFVKQLKEGIIE